jgi:Fe2+ or Zn2+ uptake regulation protein
MRTSAHKATILALLQKKHLLSIADIHKAIPEVDFSTVFRNIEQLVESKEVKKILIDNKVVMYESVKDAHDHFICNHCGTVESIHVGLPAKELKRKTVSDIIVRGTCAQCNK